MSDDADRRSLKMLLTRPELVDHLAHNVWKHETGERSHEVWTALSEEERQWWIDRMWEQYHTYANSTPDERKAINAASWERILKNNDKAFADLMVNEHD
jgi:hypothetical protein